MYSTVHIGIAITGVDLIKNRSICYASQNAYYNGGVSDSDVPSLSLLSHSLSPSLPPSLPSSLPPSLPPSLPLPLPPFLPARQTFSVNDPLVYNHVVI